MVQRVVPVIDLLGGRVVRGVAGRRSEYRPIESQIAPGAEPARIAAALVSRFGFETAYVADLDAILQGQADFASWAQIAVAGLGLMLDAGVSSLADAERVAGNAERRGLAVRLVVGLETLQSLADLAAIAGRFPAAVFSLDLKSGHVLSRAAELRKLPPLEIVAEVVAAGISDLIVLDLADVGTSGGTRTLDLCRAIRSRFALRQLIAGGGVRGLADLAALADAGCDAALVASALHDGKLTPEMLANSRAAATASRNHPRHPISLGHDQ